MHGLPASWDPVVAAVHHGPVGKAVWSPCSRFIAVSRFETVGILDAVTLKQLNTFKPQQGSLIQSLSFSPDVRFLAQFSNDELITWDLQTGGPARTIILGQDMYSVKHLSSTYSIDGKMLALAYEKDHNTLITIYNLLSGTYTSPYHLSEGFFIPPIWTHGECLQYATINSGSITIWEDVFTSAHMQVEVDSLPAPDGIADARNLLFLPLSYKLAFTLQDVAFIWDARASKVLLKSGPLPASGLPKSHRLSFSSDGCFFACTAGIEGIYVWKESSTGYILHQKFPPPVASKFTEPLLSPSGKSIVSNGMTIQLWHTKDQILSLPRVLTRESTRSFVLRFSPDETLAAFSHIEEGTITVLNLQSGDPWLVIDVDMEIDCLEMSESVLVAVGEEKIATWNLPARDHVPSTKVAIDNGAQITPFVCAGLSSDPLEAYAHTSISPDLSHIVMTLSTYEPDYKGLEIYDRFTGKYLTGTTTEDFLEPWFTPSGDEVWGEKSSIMQGWKIIEDCGIVKLEPLHSLSRLPWESSCGYKVTDDGWVLNSTQRKLLWLPHPWRSMRKSRKWSRRFLGLGDGRLQEVIILEFFE